MTIPYSRYLVLDMQYGKQMRKKNSIMKISLDKHVLQELLKVESHKVKLTILACQEGIKPMWEDDRNKKGGRWLINLDKKQRASCLDNFWLEVVSRQILFLT